MLMMLRKNEFRDERDDEADSYRQTITRKHHGQQASVMLG